MGNHEGILMMPEDYSVGKYVFSMHHYAKNKDKSYIRGIRVYNRYDSIIGEIEGSEKEDHKHTLEMLPHEKVVSVRVTTYAHLPCEISFFLVTSVPKEYIKPVEEEVEPESTKNDSEIFAVL